MSFNENFQRQFTEADTLLSSGNPARAEEIFKVLLQYSEIPETTRMLTLDGLGRALYALQRLDEAQQVFEASLELLRKLFGPSHKHVAAGLQNLARLHAAKGETAQAIKLGQEALGIAEKALEDALPVDMRQNRLQLATAYFALSSHHYNATDLEQAETCLAKALNIWEASLGRKSMEVSTCLNNLGRIYEQRGLPAQGVDFHQEAVAIRKELLGDHPETAFSLGNLGSALAENGQWRQAIDALEEALGCYQRLGQPHCVEAETCRKNLQACQRAWENLAGVPSTDARKSEA